MGSELVGEQLAGTAPYARSWIALEQNGPWGARAFTESHLDPSIGRALESIAAAHSVRPMLIRTPGRHARSDHPKPRNVVIAHSIPGRGWLAEGSIDDPRELLELDFAALASGEVPASFARTDRPHLLVCTNGTRDVCCALRGRPVAAAAARAFPDQVWEATHTSGHRFAPTAVLLPFGTLHGRLLDGTGVLHAAERGHTVLAGHRGRSCWPPPGQVAELAVRKLIGELGLDALSVSGGGSHWSVRHIDGRAWTVTTAKEDTGFQRRDSCRKNDVPLARINAEVLPSD